MTITLLTGDCRDVLPTLASNSVHCVVTSPPYAVFREVRRVLRDDAPLFTSWAPAEDPEERAMRDLFAEAAE